MRSAVRPRRASSAVTCLPLLGPFGLRWVVRSRGRRQRRPYRLQLRRLPVALEGMPIYFLTATLGMPSASISCTPPALCRFPLRTSAGRGSCAASVAARLPSRPTFMAGGRARRLTADRPLLAPCPKRRSTSLHWLAPKRRRKVTSGTTKLNQLRAAGRKMWGVEPSLFLVAPPAALQLLLRLLLCPQQQSLCPVRLRFGSEFAGPRWTIIDSRFNTPSLYHHSHTHY